MELCGKNTVLDTAHSLLQSSEESYETVMKYQNQFQLQNKLIKN